MFVCKTFQYLCIISLHKRLPKCVWGVNKQLSTEKRVETYISGSDISPPIDPYMRDFRGPSSNLLWYENNTKTRPEPCKNTSSLSSIKLYWKPKSERDSLGCSSFALNTNIHLWIIMTDLIKVIQYVYFIQVIVLRHSYDFFLVFHVYLYFLIDKCPFLDDLEREVVNLEKKDDN